MAIAVVRLRGHMRLRTTIEDTMEHLQLTRVNHCVVLPETPDVLGMVQRAKDYITWGPIQAKDVEDLIRNRGRFMGDKPMTDETVKSMTKFASIAELAKAIHEGKVRYSKIEGVKPIFRLNPPKKGLKGGTKRSVNARGNLGNRGQEMSKLIQRMM